MLPKYNHFKGYTKKSYAHPSKKKFKGCAKKSYAEKFKGCGKNQYGSLLFFVGYTEGKRGTPPFCHEINQGGACTIHELKLILSAGIISGKH